MGELELLDQLLVGSGLLERVEILAVEVLHHRLFERREVVGHPDQHGHRRQTGPFGSTPPALAGDQLVVAVVDLTDEERLQDAHFAHRGGQGSQALLVEVLAGLVRVGANQADGYLT